MKTAFLRILVAFAAIITLSACQNTGGRQIKDSDIIDEVERSASQLMDDAEDFVSPSERVIVMSFADVDDLKVSSRFGRIVAQQYAAEVSEEGYKVVEILLSDRVTIEQMEGEFLLSRDVSRLGEMHDADMVVVGTYAIGIEHVYVTAKIVRVSDAVVLAADSFELNMGPDTRRMLQD